MCSNNVNERFKCDSCKKNYKYNILKKIALKNEIQTCDKCIKQNKINNNPSDNNNVYQLDYNSYEWVLKSKRCIICKKLKKVQMNYKYKTDIFCIECND